MIDAIVATLAALALATIVGWLLTRRAGAIRTVNPGSGAELDTSDLGLSRTGPTVVHFSASWCSPCTRVRGVVSEVCGELPDVAHGQLDLEATPRAAQDRSV